MIALGVVLIITAGTVAVLRELWLDEMEERRREERRRKR